ncbi:hypothetical protein D3C78_1189170 [compost metagenome]
MVVQALQPPLRQQLAAVAGVGAHRRGAANQRMQQRQVFLRQGEHHRDRRNLRHAEQPGGVADPQQIAGIDVADAHPAVHRRGDARIGQAHPLGVDQRLVGFQRGAQLGGLGFLLVECLLGHGTVGIQQAVAPQVLLDYAQLRLAVQARRLGLGDGGGNRAVVDGRQQFALFDQFPLLHQHPGQHAVHLGAHHHVVQRGDGAYAGQPLGDVLALHPRQHHRHAGRHRGCLGPRRLTRQQPEGRSSDHRQKHRQRQPSRLADPHTAHPSDLAESFSCTPQPKKYSPL